jgi:hypothetical protein
MSAVYYNADGRDPYRVIYSINTAGQAGIVMRESEYVWGEYSDPIPLFDPVHMQFRDFVDSTGTWTTTMVRSGGACYGGYTNTELWEDAGSEGTLIRFNSSMWNPYKVLLVEALLPTP